MVQNVILRKEVKTMFLIIHFLWIITTSYSSPLPSNLPNNDLYQEVPPLLLSKSSKLDNLNMQLQIPRTYPDFKQYGRQEAVLEQEHWLSKKDSLYEKTQNVAATFLGVKPLTDTIQEHEKYGNDGEKHRRVAKKLINGIESLGNILNTIVDLPFQAKDHVGRTINAALDAVGSKLVGI